MAESAREPWTSSRVKSIGHYVLMKTIGEGTFGKVKLGTHILTGERVAVKVLEKERIVDIADVERVAREIHILKLIRHCRHIIQLYEIIETPRQLYLIMEYACGGELFDYIVQHGRAEEREACRFFHQILAGVERVHAMNVVHRDLKPENLLLDDRGDIKIVDFGLSNTHEDDQLLQTACGSPCYAAPEMIAGQRYVPCRVDIWSCGVILFALVCGYLPFEDQNHAELYKKILNADYEMPDFVSPEVADLIRGVLTTDPEKRLTLDGIRQHVWYQQIPEASLQEREGAESLDQDILDQLESYGFSREFAVKCLKTNKHNHVTTTYYLLQEKRLRERGQGPVTAVDLAIADLDASLEEDDALDQPVAYVATPARRAGSQTAAGGRADTASREGYPRRSPLYTVCAGGWRSRSTSPTPGYGSQQGAPTRRSPASTSVQGNGTPGDRPLSARADCHSGRANWAAPLLSARHPPASARQQDLRNGSPGRVYQAHNPARYGRSLGIPPAADAMSLRQGNLPPGTCQVPCSSTSPKQIMEEVLHTLRAHRIVTAVVSSFVVRGQSLGVRFQAELLKADHGGGYALRLMRLVGDVWTCKELFARLLSDLSF